MRWLVAVAALALLAACADDPADDEVAVDDEAAEDEAVDEEPDDGVRLEAADGELGTHLVDGEGMVVYLFTPDEAGESTCYDGCAETWPPLLDDDPAAGDGVDEALVGTATRDDGTEQVTYDGWPLYRFVGDEEPGEAAGQGVEDVWFVVDPDGEMIDAVPDADEAEDADDGPGY